MPLFTLLLNIVLRQEEGLLALNSCNLPLPNCGQDKSGLGWGWLTLLVHSFALICLVFNHGGNGSHSFRYRPGFWNIYFYSKIIFLQISRTSVWSLKLASPTAMLILGNLLRTSANASPLGTWAHSRNRWWRFRIQWEPKIKQMLTLAQIALLLKVTFPKCQLHQQVFCL